MKAEALPLVERLIRLEAELDWLFIPPAAALKLSNNQERTERTAHADQTPLPLARAATTVRIDGAVLQVSTASPAHLPFQTLRMTISELQVPSRLVFSVRRGVGRSAELQIIMDAEISGAYRGIHPCDRLQWKRIF